MNAPSHVKLDLRGLQQARQRIRNGQAVEEMYQTWGRRDLAFLREQFRRNRGGGGDWPPLKPETLKRTPVRLGILHVTGAIFNALRPGQPGNVLRRVRTGIAAGIEGGPKHPGTDLTIGELARIHDQGTEHIPARRIFYPPDAALKKQFQDDARRMAERLVAESSQA
jgi:hypothetical protein